MDKKRTNRISEEVKRIVSELLNNGIKDPRVNTMTTVTEVEVTNDLSFANIYVSVLGDSEDKDNSIAGLESDKGFIRSEIGKKVNLRHIPEPVFHLDESIEHAMNISKLIDEIKEKDSKNRGTDDD